MFIFSITKTNKVTRLVNVVVDDDDNDVDNIDEDSDEDDEDDDDDDGGGGCSDDNDVFKDDNDNDEDIMIKCSPAFTLFAFRATHLVFNIAQQFNVPLSCCIHKLIKFNYVISNMIS